ncbi:purine-nucleoside phosphorylase Ecym_4645 [Eremothecium cymbalariae DBVPG|uniref:Purine nucleoside phosphorylase n=1 Tax=Eremothecium cymbalariae (strain CBS 270.75 / DBVPG 7215 / KCTC 17166 / NRRL Y-17582) TaxID=931890 RepID=G8JSE6_ERECY|nr:hypothetical protein Ecym_4645 [Eremothecium cymbalariae DBVPG\
MSKMDIEQQNQLIKEAAAYLLKKIKSHYGSDDGFQPQALIICGSGLSGISKRLSREQKPMSIPYSEIPGFKSGTVAGHSSELVFGVMNNTPVVLMKGRLHGYEGHALHETTFPIRVLHQLGTVKTLIVTNASGGLNRKIKECELVCLNDHISLPGMTGNNALVGPNFDEYGPRFLAISDAYDFGLRKLLFQKHKELGMERKLHEGVYAHVSGPTYESRAESRFLTSLGADCVGMSTVPEVIVARHCGWKVLALSLITNVVVLDPPSSVFAENPESLTAGKADHEEVLRNGLKASADVERLLEEVVGHL